MKVKARAMFKPDFHTEDTDYYILPCIKFNFSRPTRCANSTAIWIEFIFIRTRLAITIYINESNRNNNK